MLLSPGTDTVCRWMNCCKASPNECRGPFTASRVTAAFGGSLAGSAALTIVYGFYCRA